MHITHSIRQGNMPQDAAVLAAELRRQGMYLNWDCTPLPGDTFNFRHANERGIPVVIFSWSRPDEFMPKPPHYTAVQDVEPQRSMSLED